MSDTLLAYVISVVILAALALFIPCIELLARLFRVSLYEENETSSPTLKVRGDSRKIV